MVKLKHAEDIFGTMPKFSIIMPAHNAEEYIRKALDSVRIQTFTDYELIVICDACSDRTAEIAKEYTDKVLVVNYANPGPTRSYGLDHAVGEYVLFIDDDDWWLHEFVLEQINEKLSGEDLLCFAFIWKGRGYASPDRGGGVLWPAVWNKCWKREAIGDTRFPAAYPDDLLFHMAMMDKLMVITYWEMPLYYYNYWRDGSISTQKEPDLRERKL